MYRFIDEAKLLDVVGRAEPKDRPSVVAPRVQKWLQRQPEVPDLIGASVVAQILGILPPNVSKLRERGVLPPPIHIAGSVDVWLRSDVEEIGARMRGDRERRRTAKGGKV